MTGHHDAQVFDSNRGAVASHLFLLRKIRYRIEIAQIPNLSCTTTFRSIPAQTSQHNRIRLGAHSLDYTRTDFRTALKFRKYCIRLVSLASQQCKQEMDWNGTCEAPSEIWTSATSRGLNGKAFWTSAGRLQQDRATHVVSHMMPIFRICDMGALRAPTNFIPNLHCATTVLRQRHH